MNVVTLIGNLATDVELKDVGESKRVASFLLAIDRASKDGGADFVRITVWDRQAELCARLPRQGQARRARRPSAQPLVGGHGRPAPERGRGGRQPRRVPFAARRGGERRRHPLRSGCCLTSAYRRARRVADCAAWRSATRSSPSPTSCSTSRPSRLRADRAPGRRRGRGDEVVCGVSASRELFEHAAAVGAQLVLVHHGLLWDNEPRDDRPAREGVASRRSSTPTSRSRPTTSRSTPIRRSATTRCSRASSASRSRARSPTIGVGGHARRAAEPLDAFVARVRERVGREPLVFPYGPDRGRARRDRLGRRRPRLAEAARRGLRPLPDGRAGRADDDGARELGIHFVAGGHYATERLGVQALAARIAERFGLEWQFIELPNPV